MRCYFIYVITIHINNIQTFYKLTNKPNRDIIKRFIKRRYNKHTKKKQTGYSLIELSHEDKIIKTYN